jgi:tRNA dimethylallyltransferase
VIDGALKRVIAILGPTASGKSELAVSLAQALTGEVISGDSMQIYQGLNIVTAKITPHERRGIPHHLLDLRRPSESFSAAEYQKLAREAIADIFSRGKTPILAGGSGLYIDSALYNYEYGRENEEGLKTAVLRETLLAEAAMPGAGGLWESLRRVDPQSAVRLHPNDTKRILRALEYERLHHKPISQNVEAFQAPRLLYPALLLGLALPRGELYQRIDARVEQMMAAGLLAEVLALRDQGLSSHSQAGQAIGYKQLLLFAGQACSLPAAVAAIKQESRRYAKRQLTWFRRNPDIIWLDGQKIQEEKNVGKLAELLRRLDEEEGDQEKAPGRASDKLRDFFNQAGIAFLNHIGAAQEHLGHAKAGNTKTDAAADQGARSGD